MDDEPLSDEERATYEWQMWMPGFGETGQVALKQASVLVSRIGGLGGLVAYQLAAAGIGRLVLAHGGVIQPSDLNRQLLMTHAALGTSRVRSAERRLKELNPRLHVDAIDSHLDDELADRLIRHVDLVVDCAPIFPERFAMNDAALRHRKPLVECAMYGMEFQLFSVLPGESTCLRCLHPTTPTTWRREFPVFGAVAGTVACMAAMEVIKILARLGEPLFDHLIRVDLATMEFRRLRLQRRNDCLACRNVGSHNRQESNRTPS